jgi:hypothetical protein
MNDKNGASLKLPRMQALKEAPFEHRKWALEILVDRIILNTHEQTLEIVGLLPTIQVSFGK